MATVGTEAGAVVTTMNGMMIVEDKEEKIMPYLVFEVRLNIFPDFIVIYTVFRRALLTWLSFYYR